MLYNMKYLYICKGYYLKSYFIGNLFLLCLTKIKADVKRKSW